MFRTMKLRQKEVINIETAQRLGFISDVEINEHDGNIEAIIVPGRGWFLSRFFGGRELVIPWQNICVIGEDLVLVKIFEICDNRLK